VQVDLAGPAAGQEGDPGGKGDDLAVVDIQGVGPQAAVSGQRFLFQFGGSDQVDGDVVLVDLDIGVLADRCHQGPLDLAAGDVLGVQDAPGAVPPLAGQVVVGADAAGG